jgi:hypothetical protein
MVIDLAIARDARNRALDEKTGPWARPAQLVITSALPKATEYFRQLKL